MNNTQVRWWDFHLWAQPYLEAAGQWPMAGTQAWFDLPDSDPRKWAAVIDGAQHHALRVEVGQLAECEASSAISAGANWAAIANRIRQQREFYAARPWLKRVAS